MFNQWFYHKFLIGFLTTVQYFSFIESSCYFSRQFQGEYQIQTSSSYDSDISYSNVNISPDLISIWGNCYKRNENNFILISNSTETSCFRCFHLKLRSLNVLQVFTSLDTISTCFTTENLAEATCPTEESLHQRDRTSEILLFKIKDDQGIDTQKQYCPIDGKYYTNYTGYIGNSLKSYECVGLSSAVDSCPSGSTLNFRLRSCTFQSFDLRFECLAHWRGPRDETYLVFIDNRELRGKKPIYRCALYKQDKNTRKIEMALSRDSNCTSDLNNATSGFETFLLAPKSENPWPADVSHGICSFPKWMAGNWEYVRVEGDTMVYKDHTSFKTYTIKCIRYEENANKYLIFSRTQCDEESYNCMRIASRSKNILEFQLGSNSSNRKDNHTLCSDENFDDNSWVTQGRLDANMQSGLCPITGDYVGRIPDAQEYCAKLWSDCRAPEKMYYQVSECRSGEILEEREYQCLGHWRESNLLYTYTERKDVADGTYECFVGSIISDKEINIKEAGEHCQRNVDPQRYGMKLIKTSSIYSCPERSTTSTTNIPKFGPGSGSGSTRFNTTTTSSVRIPQNNNNNNNIESNAIPDLPKENCSSRKYSSILLISLILIMLNLSI